MFGRVLNKRSRPWSRRLIPAGAILSFHSITTPDLPAAGSAHVSLDTFKSLIACLRRVGSFVPLSEFVKRRLAGRSTSGLIAITLDDAYAALAGEFKEFIAREAIPITIFVISGALRGERFWWDRVDDLYSRATPDQWRAFEVACGVPEEFRRGQPRVFGPLRPLRQWLLAAYAGRWPAHLEPALRALEAGTGHQTVHRAMTLDELATLTALPHVELGVHTASHPVLPLLPDAELEGEIAGSHRVLRERFAAVVPVLAVPFGLYDERTLRAARGAGMATSLTLAADTLNHGAVRDALPRFCVTTRDTTGRLALRLSGLAQAVRACSGQRQLYPDLPSSTS